MFGRCLLDSDIRELTANKFLILSLDGKIFLVSQSELGNELALLVLSYLMAVNSRNLGKIVCDSQIGYDFWCRLTVLFLKTTNSIFKYFREFLYPTIYYHLGNQSPFG